MKDDRIRVAGAFLAGGLVGAALALLYAPQSGSETRRDIAKSARRIKKGAVEMAEDTIESITDFADDIKDRASDIIESGIEMSEHAKKEIIKSFEDGQRAIEKQKRRVMNALSL